MPLPAGARFGPYELTGVLGAGGMGEVYRARDTKLGRDVAVKVLPADVAGDAESRARFEQEARSASALNHPNIITIHDIGTADGALYIAMELVEGRTLRELVAAGALSTRKLLPIAAQVADGLAKAHAAGLVHRDLKPENVMVNKDGFVKILDFGLAKLVLPAGDGASELATMTAPGTRPGVVLGTVGYMSPEQASGQPVDFRSDQFSLGAILYEMTTGRRAFQKKTAVETLSAIIREDPEPIAVVNPTAPSPLRWIVERCLAKEAEDRYASTRDLARDLKQTLEHLSETSGEAPAVTRPRSKPRFAWAAAIAALLLVGASDLALRLRSGAPSGKSPARLKRVTFAPGLEDEPSFSPDGRFLAYTSDERGNLDIVVLPLSGGEPIRIGEGNADSGEAAWSPDGSRLAFVSARDHGGRLGIALNVASLEPYLNAKFGDLFLVPALGGTAVKLVEDAYYPSWAPDGKRIAFMSNRERELNLWTVSTEGGSPARLTKGTSIDYQPAWSPDGHWVAYGGGESAKGRFNLWVVEAGGGQPRQLTTDFTYVTKPAWSADGKSILFSGDRNGILNVWRIAFSAKEESRPERVTLGQGQDTGVSVTRDGQKLAFASVRNESNIWELTVATGQLRAVTSGASGPDYPELSPDGKTLLVRSNRTGENAVWSVDLQGRFLSALSPGQDGEPQAKWSPDGRRFSYARAGENAGPTLRLQGIGDMNAQDTGVAAAASEWSPDGKAIAVGFPSGPGEIVLYDVESRKAAPITSVKSEVDYPTWSPDGKQIAFQVQRGPIREIWVVPSAGGAARPLTRDLEDSHPAWSPTNPDEILFLRDHKRLATVLVSTGKVTLLPGYSEGSFVLDYPSWSRDGKKVYFSVARKSGDLYVLEGF